MQITLCLKQVPGTTTVEIDEKTGVLKRDGVDSKLNPYDLYAIETAMQLKSKYGAFIKAITMGPPQAISIIKESFMMGVDQGVILSDRAFAGADVLATSYALSQGIKKLGKSDLIICGKQTTDGDTAQVGPEIAEYLDIPHVCNVTKIVEVMDDSIIVEMDMGESVEVQEVLFPCLITVEQDIFIPRLPSYKKMLETVDRDVPVITLQDLEDKDSMMYGLNGSPTQVERIFPPQSLNEKTEVKGTDDEIATFLYDKLKELKFI